MRAERKIDAGADDKPGYFFKCPKARFPLGEFVRANRQKSKNASYLFAANFSASQF